MTLLIFHCVFFYHYHNIHWSSITIVNTNLGLGIFLVDCNHVRDLGRHSTTSRNPTCYCFVTFSLILSKTSVPIHLSFFLTGLPSRFSVDLNIWRTWTCSRLLLSHKIQLTQTQLNQKIWLTWYMPPRCTS